MSKQVEMKFDTKPMYASVASYAKSERAKAEAVLRADQAGMKAYWIESSEKALLENNKRVNHAVRRVKNRRAKPNPKMGNLRRVLRRLKSRAVSPAPMGISRGVVNGE